MAPQTSTELAAAVERDGIEFLFAMFVHAHAMATRTWTASHGRTRRE